MVFRVRSHSRSGWCLALIAVAALCLAPATQASNTKSRSASVHASYLALGDSLAFGYSQAKFNSLLPSEPASAYNTGYVDDFGKVLRLFHPGLRVVNDGCPGETTDSLINGPCQYQLAFPLHHPYSGGVASSQLSDALAYLAAHPGSVNPITIDIGANDALAVNRACNADPACIAAQAPALITHIATNLGSILQQLRAAAPNAQIIVLGLYNPFGATIAGADQLTMALNTAEAQVAGSVNARFADPFPLFNPAGAREQPTLCVLTNICTPLVDIHPTDLGYLALAGVVARQYAFHFGFGGF
ncbi:MAG TPA: SGNH/GDSL hydrolase family protein [Solirubrobacteraceae bacterium]|nr:SGNH/GDSL hydrolase family protein [Solirubrobacteraceae bacterium]